MRWLGEGAVVGGCGWSVRRVAGGGSFGGVSVQADGGEVHLDGGFGP